MINMKQKISICILLLAFTVISASLFGREKKLPPPATQQAQVPEETEESITVNADGTTDEYVLRMSDGRIVVYYGTGSEVYMVTDIIKEDLPADILERLEQGIGFADQKSLFEFLENYSS